MWMYSQDCWHYQITWSVWVLVKGLNSKCLFSKLTTPIINHRCHIIWTATHLNYDGDVSEQFTHQVVGCMTLIMFYSVSAVAVRTPMFKRVIFDKVPITEQDMKERTRKARTGDDDTLWQVLTQRPESHY